MTWERVILSLEDEQREIVDIVDSRCKDLKRGWNKFKGDVVCRVIKTFIERHATPNLKVIGPNIFLEGFPYEFDLAIACLDAEARDFTSSFEPRNIKCVIEVKKGGVFSPQQPEKISEIFNKVVSKYPHIKCAYLTVEEAIARKRSSKNFFQISKDELSRHGHGFFALRDLRGERHMILGEWEKFLNFVEL